MDARAPVWVEQQNNWRAALSAPRGGGMQVDLNRVIEQVSKEKGIDKTIVINAVEEMMHSAARRTFGPDRNIESRFNPELGEIELFEIKTVVEKVANAAAEADVAEARAKYDPEAEV